MIGQEEKKKILDNVKTIEGTLLHMNLDPEGKTNHQRECRDVIRGYLRNIRTVCGQVFTASRSQDQCSLPELRDVTTCPFCGHVQVATLGLDDHCEKADCRGIIIDYYGQLTWKLQ